jgi:NADPH:quinone reductase-like Zn-dependent oxidoreductase
MKAIVHHRYGPPEVLGLEDVPQPTLGDDDVLVRVHAASVNAGDWHLMRADPFFIRFVFGGILNPKFKVLGSDLAGRVEAVGRKVKEFQPGDEVFGATSGSGFGAFAEYARVPAAALLPKPVGISFEEAAAVPVAATTALQALRDKGGIQAGQKVLVNGASGGVGTFAVQLARAFGAEVTGVCSTRNLDLVRSIGAQHVVDYTREDFTRGEKRYDLIVDAAAFRSVREYRRALTPEGTYVMVGGATSRMFQTLALGLWVSRTGSQRMESVLARLDRGDLALLKDLLESGEVVPVIDRSYTLAEVPEAIRYLEKGHARGKVVITV